MLSTREVKESGTTATDPGSKDKTIVITGGSRGIGASTALAFAANGASIVVVGRDQVAIDGIVEAANSLGTKAIGVAADCANAHDLISLKEVVEGEYGSLAILLNFAR